MAAEKRSGFPANVGDFVSKHPLPVILGAGALLQQINPVAAASVLGIGLVRPVVPRTACRP